MNRAVLRLAAAALTLLGIAACTSSRSPAPNTPSADGTRTIVHTRPPQHPIRFRPAPAATVRPLPYGEHPRPGEKAGYCPYIKTGLNQQDAHGATLADIEGDRVYLTTRLTKYRPVGCRFYFYAPPYEALTDIRPMTMRSKADAFNAMVLIADAGRQQITEKDFAPGLTGICYRTKYFGPDGHNDWAFVFAKGRVVVDILTQRNDTSRPALYLAQAIAAKF